MAKKEINRAFDYSKYPEWIDPNEVRPYENNAKLHPPEQVRTIVNSIKRFGWQQDTVITSDNVVVVGHGRRLAAIEIGCKMPFHRVGKTIDELTEKEIDALRLADNQTNANSGFNFGKLQSELNKLSDFGMSDFGFQMSNDGSFMQPVQHEEEAADELPDFGDEGYKEYQEPLSNDELEKYSDNAEDFLLKRRVIITYMPEQEEEVKRMLGITDDKMHVVYDFNELMGVGAE